MKTCWLWIAALAVPAFGHHSFNAEYDESKPVSVTGVVTKVEWQNPHIWFYVDETKADGSVTHWAFSGGAPGQLMRRGITRDVIEDPEIFTDDWTEDFAMKARPDWDKTGLFDTSAKNTTTALAEVQREVTCGGPQRHSSDAPPVQRRSLHFRAPEARLRSGCYCVHNSRSIYERRHPRDEK